MAQPTSIETLRALFDAPPRGFGPTPLWWWSGAKVTPERLRWQMERFAAGGIFNLVVINLAPAGPIVGAVADDPPWFSEEWWARFTQACEVASELGMTLWFYDQIGFSGANIQGSITRRHPEAAGRGLRSRTVQVQGGRVELLGPEELIGLYADDGTRVEVGTAGSVASPDGSALQLVTSVPTAFDYLSPDAVALLMDLVHGEFERRLPQYLGNVIAGSFQDELPATNAWTPGFPEQFRRRRGYDLLDHLPALWSAPTSGAAADHDAKVRGDYYAVRAELTEEALFRPLGEWHNRRQMLLGCDQFSPARAGYPSQSTQLYTDYFRTHRWYNAAGSDHEGDAKVHSSMAHLYGHERVWIESFHSSGWGGTLEDTYDWLLPFLRSGANLYDPHATYFGTAGGWFEWAPPSTDWRQPYWRHYPQFSAAVSRIASIMSQGSYSADVAVLHPTATAQALLPLQLPVDHFGSGQLGGQYADLDRTQADYLALVGSNNWFRSQPSLLDAAGISFDVIDDDSVQRSELVDDRLRVRDLGYATVILPSTSVLETGTARQLIRFVDQGGRLIVLGRRPTTAAGVAGDDAVVQALAASPGVVHVDTAAAAVAAISDRGYAFSEHALLVRRLGTEAVALVMGAFPNASRYPLRTGPGFLWSDYDFDNTRYAPSVDVTVRARVASAELWDPVAGTTRPVRVTVHGGSSVLTAELDGAPAALLVWREGEPGAVTVRADGAATTPRDVSTGWSGRLVPTIDNTWGDLALPAGTPLTELQVWSLEWTESGAASEGATPDDWQRVRVTQGQRVRVLGPVAVSNAQHLDENQVLAVLGGTAQLTDGSEEDSWTTATYSTSRGREKDRGLLGNKGLVPEEFLSVPAPGQGEVVVLRAVVRVEHLGPAHLVLGAGAARRAWWNGVELVTGAGYLSTSDVPVDREINVLEVHLGPSENVLGHSHDNEVPPLGCFFAVAQPGAFGVRPAFMTAGEGTVADGRVRYVGQLEVPGTAVTSAALVAGAATGLSIFLDDQLVARQEKVEYYESSWGATPMFFSHDVTGLLGPGEHRVELVADSTDARDVVLFDLVVLTDAGVTTLVSGDGWTTAASGEQQSSVEHRGHWGELAHVHVAERSHPLPDAAWLHGEPVIGARAERVLATDTLDPAAQRFRVLLPAGTVEVELPLSVPAEVSLDGRPPAVAEGRITLDEPLPAPAELEVRTGPVAFDRGGAAWRGPLLVRTLEAPIELANWQEIGLRAWSGAVRYRRTIEVPADAEQAVLDLGGVRGSVDVAVDGVVVGSAFCAPFRFDLGDARGLLSVDVTVYNTLAPFLDESTPTMWVFPSQLVSGLLGPVTLRLSGPVPA